MGRFFATTLLAALLAGPALTLADTVIDLPECVGPMPPDRSFSLTMPANMQDVQSLRIRLVGECFQGLMICDESPAFPIWVPPQVEIYRAGPPVDYFLGMADEASIHGPFDVTFALSPLLGTEPSQLAGQTVTFNMGLWITTIPACYTTEVPTAIIDVAQLRLVNRPIAAESRTWSAVKALYR
jgi:hypothetical protein